VKKVPGAFPHTVVVANCSILILCANYGLWHPFLWQCHAPLKWLTQHGLIFLEFVPPFTILLLMHLFLLRSIRYILALTSPALHRGS